MPYNKILVFTATYNEKDNIKNLIYQIKKNLRNCDILVIDDNSPDGTGKVLDELKEHEDINLSVIHRTGKLGLGSAHLYAMRYAIENNYEVLITMDADFSHNPDDIPRLLEKLNNADFVIGSRYADGGKSDYSGYRQFISKTGNWLAKKTLGFTISEVTTSFRCFRTSMLKKLDLSQIKSDGYSFFLECVFYINYYGFILLEIPIHFKDREQGISKISKLQIVYSLVTLLKLILIRLFKIKENKISL